jgi:hypothetical protein
MERGQACHARAETEGNLAKAMRASIPWLGSVHVTVDPGGEGLSRYVRRHCRPPALPGGGGEVIFSAQGVGLSKTAHFTVRSSHWTVEYLNGARELHMLLLRDGQPTDGSVDVTTRGPGRHGFSGGGTYSLQIASTGEWLVRVRDGG